VSRIDNALSGEVKSESWVDVISKQRIFDRKYSNPKKESGSGVD
jgi:hypothetical protein